MSKVVKYLKKYRSYMRLNYEDQESIVGNNLWDNLDRIWKRLSPEDRKKASDTLEKEGK